MIDDSKQEREREFHNKIFANQTRLRIGGAYSIVRDSKKAFELGLFDDCKGKTILEYGCGTGTYSFKLSALGAKVTGIDISDVAIEKASARAAAENLSVRYARMDAEDLQFDRASFDVVCGVAILHHLDLEKAFSSLTRVLKPGGKALFMEPLGHNPAINLVRRMTPNLRTPDEHPLMSQDLQMARKFFGTVDIQYFHITTLLAVPLRNTRLLNPALTALGSIDRFLFWSCRPLRRWAWQVVLTMSDPKP